jgi:phosphate transport system substrate-binding protein
MKKQLPASLLLLALCFCFFSCGAELFSPESEIHVFGREEGSGTRDSFEIQFGLRGENGRTLTAKDAIVARSNGVVLFGVSSDPAAIGYLSMASSGEGVRTLAIDGVFPSEETVKSGDYPATRPFSLVTHGESEGVSKDFLSFVLSDMGAEIISQMGYVPLSQGHYEATVEGGELILVGSSSVAPLAERLRERYLQLIPNARIEIQSADTASGIRSVRDGTCDFGMVSRALSEEELADGLRENPIAADAIVIAVHPKNPISEISSESVRGIFSGEVRNWKELMRRENKS